MERPSNEIIKPFIGSEPSLLKKFMNEFFPYGEFKKSGIFTKEMKGDYPWMAYIICNFLGLSIIYEYRKDDTIYHATYEIGKRPDNIGFTEIIPSIYK